MKPPPHFRLGPIFLRSLLPSLTVLCLTGSLQAADVVKSDSGTDLNTGASWGGTAPTSADNAVWDAPSLGGALSLGSAASWGGIKVNGATANIAITGAGALTLGSAGIDTTGSNIDFSIANNIALSGSSWWTADTGNTITASGVISGNATLNLGTRGVTLNSYIPGTPATTTISNTSLSDISAITGQMAGGFVDGDYLGSAAYKYANDGSTATYQIRLIDGGFTKSVGVTLTQSGADILATVNYAKFITGSNLANDFDTTGTAGSIATSDSGNGYGAARTSLAFAPTADQLGTITLSGNNTFTGGAAVYGGTVKIGHLNAFGTNNRTNVGKVVVAAGGTVDFNGVIDAEYGYTIAGTGVGGNGALVNNGSAIGTGIKQATNIALSADASIGGTGEWNLIAGSYAATNLYLNGNTLTKTGGNTIGLVNTTIRAGTVRISQGTLRLGPASAGVNGSAAAFTLDNVSGATLNVNLNSSVGSLAGGGSTGGNVSIANTRTLTVGALNASTTFSGAISGSGGALTKTGSGNLTLSGSTANTYTGLTTVSSGTLTLDKNDGVIALAGSVLVNGTGTLVSSANRSGRIADSANVTIDGSGASFQFGANQNDTINTLAVNNGGTVSIGGTGSNLRPNGGITSTGGGSITMAAGGAGLNFNGATRTVSVADNTLTISAPISNGGLTKSGNGSLILSGASTYAGDTTISAGTLLANNSSGSATGSSTVNVGADGTLGGTGSITGAVNVTGVLSPGASIQSLAVGNLTMLSGSTLAIELNSGVAPAGGADLLVAAAVLGLNNVTLSLSDIAVTPVAFSLGTTFTLMNYGGTAVTSGFAGLNDGDIFTAGLNQWQIDYDALTDGSNFTSDFAQSNFINITAIPESGTSLTAALGVLLLLRRNRRNE